MNARLPQQRRVLGFAAHGLLGDGFQRQRGQGKRDQILSGCYPYHYRGQDLEEFATAMTGSGVDVRIRDWYAK